MSMTSPLVNIFLPLMSIPFFTSPCTLHILSMTQLTATLFLEKRLALVAKHKGADLTNLICADESEPESRFADVDFGAFHCC